jgi:uncharacterized repeat protein (TIGR01451 family)
MFGQFRLLNSLLFLAVAMSWPAMSSAAPDLAIEKTVDNPNPIGGEPVEFTVRVTNVGDEPATFVLVHDELPPELAIPDGMAAFVSVGDYDFPTGDWTVGALNPAETAVMTMPAAVITDNPPACIVNEATTALAEDMNPDNDMAIAAIRQAGTERCVGLDLSFAISASDYTISNPVCNSEDQYTGHVKVTNHGPDAARNVAVFIGQTPELGPNLRFEDVDCDNAPDSVCNISVIDAGETITIDVISDMYQSYSSESVTLSVSVTTTDPDYDVSNNSFSVTATVGGFSYCYTGGSNLYDPPAPWIDSIGPGCFIATAAFGSSLDPHVESLRQFRDRYLATNRAGRAFVRFYYRYSPPIADYIAPRPWLRTFTRVLLAPLLLGVSYPLGALGFLVLLSAGVFFRVRKRYQAGESLNSAAI